MAEPGEHRADFSHWYERDVTNLVAMDRVEEALFRGRENQWNVNGFIYGGQVVAQALTAACGTVSPDRTCHSLHAYFLRGGDATRMVECTVETTREGRGFSTRRVVARQGEAIILHAECSFRLPDTGFEHQTLGPVVPAPETLPSLEELAEARRGILPDSVVDRFARPGPIAIRPVSEGDMFEQLAVPERSVWMRVPSAVNSDDPFVHQQVLTYASDYWLSGVVPAAHTWPVPSDDIFIASVDHAIWFHRPTRADEWLLYHNRSDFAGGGTGLSRGVFYDRERRPVATVMQEAVVRRRRT